MKPFKIENLVEITLTRDHLNQSLFYKFFTVGVVRNTRIKKEIKNRKVLLRPMNRLSLEMFLQLMSLG